MFNQEENNSNSQSVEVVDAVSDEKISKKVNIHTFTSSVPSSNESVIMLSSNEGNIMKVGRSPDCYVPLKFESDRHISKTHAILWITKTGQLYLMDMESQNGSFVNDIRLQPNTPQKINHGDVVSFSKNASYVYNICEHVF